MSVVADMAIAGLIFTALLLIYIVGHGAAERARLADFDRGDSK